MGECAQRVTGGPNGPCRKVLPSSRRAVLRSRIQSQGNVHGSEGGAEQIQRQDSFWNFTGILREYLLLPGNHQGVRLFPIVSGSVSCPRISAEKSRAAIAPPGQEGCPKGGVVVQETF